MPSISNIGDAKTLQQIFPTLFYFKIEKVKRLREILVYQKIINDAFALSQVNQAILALSVYKTYLVRSLQIYVFLYKHTPPSPWPTVNVYVDNVSNL